MESLGMLHSILNNYLPVAPKGFVDEGFNVNEHNRIFGAASTILQSDEATDEDLSLAISALRISCHGHLLDEEDGKNLLRIAEELGHQEDEGETDCEHEDNHKR